eukprot:PhF_6_TR42944/c0_g1_i1/m.65261
MPVRMMKPTFGDDNIGTTLYAPIGFESFRKDNAHYLDEHNIIVVAGNTIQFINLTTGNITSEPGRELGGIGCVAVHPQRECYVVCENSPQEPRVLVYHNPSRKLTNTLKGGAVQGFTTCSFNVNGDKLVTVAMEPDYVITIWNWKEQLILLRNKAFGNDVFRVSFNPLNEGILTTTGVGHIKFWTMANTFTGLKLQGQVGKFGRVEISDVVGHVNLPDGKVLSGSESGMLLLWEGMFIKCEIGRKHPTRERAPCHDGCVEVLYFLEGSIFMSGGFDGYIRYWSLSDVDAAESSDADACCLINCLREVYVGDNVKIRGMALSCGGDHWIVQDANGQLLRAPYLGKADMHELPLPPEKQPQSRPLLTFHAGPINCVDTSHKDHTCVTGGSDGTIRLFDYIKRKELYKLQLNSAVTTLKFFPASQDPTGGHFYCGFGNGCIRVLSKCADGFDLVSVCKPHSDAVVSIAFDRQWKRVATASLDKTIFFFQYRNPTAQLEPLCYVNLFEVPTCLAWNRECTHLYVGLKNGRVIRVEYPTESGDPNSFERPLKYEGLGFRQFMKKPEKKQKSKDDDHGPSHDDDDDDDEEEDEHADRGPWPISFIEQFGEKFGNTVLIGIRHPESCFEYFLSKWYPNTTTVPVDKYGAEIPGTLDEPLRNLSWRNVITTTCTLTKSEKFVLIGCKKGRILIRPTFELERCYLGAQLHSGQTGDILQVCSSFDDSLILTAGRDGMVFVQQFLDHEIPKESLELKSLPIRRAAVGDIAQVDALSIQMQKIKDDADKVRDSAEAKKETLRHKVATLQKEYEDILSANDNAPFGKRLSEEELVLDPEVIDILKKENEKRVEEAKLEFAWVTAKKEVALKKLSDMMWGRVMLERIVLHAFESKQTVATFRTGHFTERQKKYIAGVHEIIDSIKQQQNQDDKDGDDVAPEDMEDTDMSPRSEHKDPENTQTGPPLNFTSTMMSGSQEAVNTQMGGTNMLGGTDLLTSTMKKLGKSSMTVKSQLEKTEMRRKERSERLQGRKELESRKPKDDEDDPKDVAAINRAKKFMGDYKLKSDPEYDIPDKHKVTAERKMRQLILNEEMLTKMRMDFNEKFLALRDYKKRLIVTINNDRARIQQINQLLNIEENIDFLTMKPEEIPEQRTESNKEILMAFEREQAKAAKRAEALERAKKGFGGDLAVMEDEPEAESEDKGQQGNFAGAKRSSLRGNRRERSSISAKERMDFEMKHRMEAIKHSDLELEERSLEREALLFEKSRLQRKILKIITAFDDAVDELRRLKMQMESDLKMADMKVQLVFRELRLLNDFRKKDTELTKKYEDKRHEKHEIVAKIQACFDKLNDKAPEVEAIDARGNEILDQCKALLSDHPASTILYKIFKRKIKRRKKLDQADDDDESESSEDEMDDDEEDDDLVPLENESCPPNCDEDTYQAVLALREQRLDQEDLFVDFNKSIETLKKENEGHMKKERAIEADLKKIEKEMAIFQNEKQNQLNQLETIVVLNLMKIQCLTRNLRMPRNDNDLVVFTQEGLRGLRQRIIDLGVEKQRLRKAFADLKREEVKLTNVRHKLQAHVSEWEAKVHEVQLLKFGQKVDLDRLENVSVDRETENLKLRLKAEEIKWERELNKVTASVEEIRMQYQNIVNSNSSLLTDLGNARQDQQRIEEELNLSSNKVVTRMSGGSAVATEADRTHLKELVVVQQSEIDSLKNEIAMLRRKGGHVYTPIVHKQDGTGSATPQSPAGETQQQ